MHRAEFESWGAGIGTSSWLHVLLQLHKGSERVAKVKKLRSKYGVRSEACITEKHAMTAITSHPLAVL